MAGEYVGTTQAVFEKCSGDAFLSRPAKVVTDIYRAIGRDGNPVPLTEAEREQQRRDVAEWSLAVPVS